MSRLIDADKLEPDTEWNDYDDDFVSYSQSQIRNAEEVQAIRLDKVKQARDEIQEIIDMCDNDPLSDLNRKNGKYRCIALLHRGLKSALEKIDKLIEESEGNNEDNG